jgi:transcription initiation factor TFIID subunit 5
MDEEAVVKFVETYLKKKGFKQAELAFQEEIQQQQQKQNNSKNAINIHSDPDLSTLLHSLSQ